jgi:D-3-phosphoglycerate dehydrogenase
VGLDNVDREYAKSKGIEVTNTPEASSVAVAELAMALMLAAPNHIITGHNGMAEGKWLKKELKRAELFRKTLGLVGLGRIGSEVAKRARGFEMDVLAFDPYVEKSEVARMCELDEVLSNAEYLSLHLPLTDETRGMINSELLAKTKPGVIIVNTGRGPCVDEASMAKALEEGHVGCYATDVWSSDPPPEDSPLLSAPRMIMTPHIGASSKENLLRIGDIVVEKIREFAKK